MEQRKLSPTTPKAQPDSLWRYFEESFAPQLKNLKPGTTNEYRKALRSCLAFGGVELSPDEVTEFFVDRWHRHLILGGLSVKTARQYAALVRRVVRSACPDRCLKKAGKRPHEEKPQTIRGMSDEELRAPAKSLLRFFQDEYVSKRMIGAKQGSIDQIRWSIQSFARFLGRAPIISDLCEDTVTAFVRWTVKVRGNSVATANSKRRDLLTLWNYAVRKKLLRESPDVEKLREPRQLPKAWTMEEFGRILNAARSYDIRTRQAFAFRPGDYFTALFLVGYDTGLRLGALLKVRRDDWKPERREITVDAEHQKQAVAQTFVLSAETAEAVQRMLANQRTPGRLPFLFSWPSRKDSIFPHIRNILQAAGLYMPGEDTFHRLRKTSATHLTAAVGLEAACRQLGHSSVEMTRRYVDPRLTGNHNAAEHLPRPDRSSR